MNDVKIFICTFAGVAGSLFTKIFGGWSDDMITLIIFMAVDFIMGLIVAGVFKTSGKTKSGTLNSKASFKGLCKKCVMLLFVLIACRLDMLLGVDYIRAATVIGFILNEAISIVENAGLMGIPLPETIKKAIEILKNRSGGE